MLFRSCNCLLVSFFAFFALLCTPTCPKINWHLNLFLRSAHHHLFFSLKKKNSKKVFFVNFSRLSHNKNVTLKNNCLFLAEFRSLISFYLFNNSYLHENCFNESFYVNNVCFWTKKSANIKVMISRQL